MCSDTGVLIAEIMLNLMLVIVWCIIRQLLVLSWIQTEKIRSLLLIIMMILAAWIFLMIWLWLGRWVLSQSSWSGKAKLTEKGDLRKSWWFLKNWEIQLVMFVFRNLKSWLLHLATMKIITLWCIVSQNCWKKEKSLSWHKQLLLLQARPQKTLFLISSLLLMKNVWWLQLWDKFFLLISIRGI